MNTNSHQYFLEPRKTQKARKGNATSWNAECSVMNDDRRRQRLSQGDSKESSDWQLKDNSSLIIHLSACNAQADNLSLGEAAWLKEIQR
jgi:hypothetical protein